MGFKVRGAPAFPAVDENRVDKKGATGKVKADTQQSAMTDISGEPLLLDKRKISKAF